MQIIGKYECKQFSYRNYFSEDISIIKKLVKFASKLAYEWSRQTNNNNQNGSHFPLVAQQWSA